MTIEVLVELKAKQIDQTFTYHVPKHLEPEIMVGKRVFVPFGKQKLEGFILKINTKQPNIDYELKDIIQVIDERPVINEEMMEIGKFISKTEFKSLKLDKIKKK